MILGLISQAQRGLGRHAAAHHGLAFIAARYCPSCDKYKLPPETKFLRRWSMTLCMRCAA